MTESQISRNRMGSIDTWSFGEGNASYADRFELVVGCTAARYAEIVDPKALLELRTEDAEKYAAAAVTPPDPAPHSITFRKNLPVHCVRRGGPRGGCRDDKCRTR